MSCHCGSGLEFAACCSRLLSAAEMAPSAEALMRSRYTAYCRLDGDYLLATWHPSTRPAMLQLTDEPRPKWLGLKVMQVRNEDADHATVEFVARYKIGGRAFRLHELSRFVRENGCWYYVDGDVAEK